MFGKLKKAWKVAKDLDTLDFTFDSSRASHDGLPFTLDHPNKLYTIWSANGFWFTALYEIDNKCVDNNHDVSKFGVIGKIVVWWKCQKHIDKWHKKYTGKVEDADKLLITKLMEG